MKTETLTERTKGEWKVIKQGEAWKVKEWAAIANMQYGLGDSDFLILAPVATDSVLHMEAEANAAFICKAVNNYDSLLSALRMFRESYSISKTGMVIINTQKHIDATQFCEEAIKNAEQ